jgi:hypothetical protein
MEGQMAWTSTLAADLKKDMPLVLAGPMLRRVTPTSVTVWLALRESRNVTLIVSDAYGADSGAGAHVQASANRDTVQIGTYLHLVAVTARLAAGKKLAQGSIYFYDLLFAHSGGRPQHLNEVVNQDADGSSVVAYSPFDLPSFVLPPSDLNQLRLMHGSCRKAHADGADTLAILDGLIEQTAQNAAFRPHQLLLTGDQIYADDVADGLLMALSDAAETLLGWKEILPVRAFGSSAQTSTVKDWPPEFRHGPFLVAGFTSDDVRSHLMSLGEYLALYLFAWSDVLWPKTMPNYDDLKASAQPILPLLKNPDIEGIPSFENYLRGPVAIGFPPYLNTIGIDFRNLSPTEQKRALTLSPGLFGFAHRGSKAMAHRTWEWDTFEYVRMQDRIEKDGKNVEGFRNSVTKVRRALANIPTYMICDDHEVTDDWNETRNFCAGVYGSPFGRRVVQNGLVAYALCQAWGNTPEQFEGSGSDPPAGLQLLQLLDKGTAQSYEQNSEHGPQTSIQRLVGVHDDYRLLAQPDNAVFHDQTKWATVQGVQVSTDSLTYNYSIEYSPPSGGSPPSDGWPHHIVVTDSRTWRSFPKGGDEAPELIPNAQLAAQVGGPVVPDGQVLIVVLTTNAPPVQPIRTAALHRTISGIYYGDLWDSWSMASVPLDRLFARLTDRLPPMPFTTSSNPTRTALTGPIVLLSGDVHHSFASRMNFQGSARFEDSQPKAVSAVIAQLVSSSLKNQAEKTLGLHLDGYTYRPGPGQWPVPDHVPEYYAGWNVKAGTSFTAIQIVKTLGGTDPAIHSADVRSNKPTEWLKPLSSAGGRGLRPRYRLNPAPDYRYLLEYLVTSAQGEAPSPPPHLPPPIASATAADRQLALQQFNKATGYYRSYKQSAGDPRPIVGRNNLGEVTFDWGAGNARTVKHTLRWWRTDDPADGSLFEWSTYAVSLDPMSPASLVSPWEIKV